MFSRSVMRAVLRWCSARSSSSNVLLISATASFFLSFSWREISLTSSMAAVSWGSLRCDRILCLNKIKPNTKLKSNEKLAIKTYYSLVKMGLCRYTQYHVLTCQAQHRRSLPTQRWQMPNLGQLLRLPNTWCEGNILKALSRYQAPTCCVWHPAVSSAQPCVVPQHPAEEQSHAPGARPLYSPDTWLSHTTRSRTPSPTGGDKLSKKLSHSCWALQVCKKSEIQLPLH